MTTRLIVPAEATEEMVKAAKSAHHNYIRSDDASFILAASLAASPASGKVSEADVEKAARAAFNSLPWEEYSNFDRQNYIHMIERALASLGL